MDVKRKFDNIILKIFYNKRFFIISAKVYFYLHLREIYNTPSLLLTHVYYTIVLCLIH